MFIILAASLSGHRALPEEKCHPWPGTNRRRSASQTNTLVRLATPSSYYTFITIDILLIIVNRLLFFSMRKPPSLRLRIIQLVKIAVIIIAINIRNTTVNGNAAQCWHKCTIMNKQNRILQIKVYSNVLSIRRYIQVYCAHYV